MSARPVPLPPPVLHALTAPVERIVLFRALMLGDLLCAVPAWRAIRAAWPQAQITLVGLGWARALAQRLSCVDEFVELPGWPGLPEVPCDVRALPDVLAGLQAQRHDLALQMHGSGEVVNPLVACFGARRMAGFVRPGVWRPAADEELFCPWPEHGHEIERLLTLTDHLGLPRQGTALEFPVTDDDRRALHAAWPAASARPYVCVHPGSQLPSRRWDPRRFAAVADALAEHGLTVVLTGSASEAGLVADVRACMRHTPVDLCGRTDLWMLGALLDSARLLVCNDTGLSHIAAALRVPSVVVSCGSDVARWAPLDARRHRVLSVDVECRPCGHRVCPHEGHPCAGAVAPADVVRAVLDQLGAVPA